MDLWPSNRFARPRTRVPSKKAAKPKAVTIQTSTTSRDTLSTELWVLIIKELEQITDKLSKYRLISRRFDAIVTPFVFRVSRVTGEFTSVINFGGVLPARTSELIKAHATRLVFGEEDLDWDRAAQFINECVRVKDIEWNHGHTDFAVAFPPAIRKVLEVDKPQLSLHLKGFYNQKPGEAKTRMIPDFDAVPRLNLVSFSTDCGYWTHHLATLQQVLVASKKLSTLSIMAGGKYYPRHPSTITQFTVQDGLLPPIKSLTIAGAWKYTKEDIPKIWNFSNLEFLHIRDRCVHGFLMSVPGNLVAGIRRLRIDDVIGAVSVPRHVAPAPLAVMEEFMGNINGLVNVHFVSPLPKNLIPMLAGHASTLKYLKLFDTNTRRPTINYDDLLELQAALPNLYELQLDLYFLPKGDSDEAGPGQHVDNKYGWYIREFRLGVIASNTNLRILHIRPQTSLQEYGVTYRKPFCDNVVKELVSKKRGKPFKEITIHWRRRQGHVPAVRHDYIAMKYQWSAFGEMSSQVILGPKVLGN